MATAPRPGGSRRAAEDELHITLSVDGEVYTLYANDITAHHAVLLRRATGMSLAEFFAAMNQAPGIDIWAAFVFLARLQAGENVTYADVANDITFTTTIATAEPAEEADSPEA